MRMQDVSGSWPHVGEVGLVRSTWGGPAVAFEVEVGPSGEAFQTRCPLASEQVAVRDGSDGEA